MQRRGAQMAPWTRYRCLGEIRPPVCLPPPTDLTLLKGFSRHQWRRWEVSVAAHLSLTRQLVWSCSSCVSEREDDGGTERRRQHKETDVWGGINEAKIKNNTDGVLHYGMNNRNKGVISTICHTEGSKEQFSSITKKVDVLNNKIKQKRKII